MELDMGTLWAIMIALSVSWFVMGLLIFRVIELGKAIESKNNHIIIQTNIIDKVASEMSKEIIKAIGKSKNHNEQFGVGPS